MTIKTRRLIYSVFMLIFLIAAPILILYAAGYRYSFKKNKFQKTGAIFAETEPKGAAIFIEDEKYQDKTTAQINNLLSGEYLIRLEKDDYYPWQKKLNIEPEKVTFIKKLVLFKKNTLPIIMLEKPALASLPSPDSQNLISVIFANNQQELWLTALARQESSALPLAYQAEKKFELIDWSPNNKKILIREITKQKTDYLVVNAEKPEEIMALSKFSSLTLPLKDLQRIKWDLNNDNYLYIQKGAEIYQINLATQTTELQKIKTPGDFLLVDGSFYYLQEKESTTYLIKNSLTNPAVESEPIIKLPSSKNYVFLASLPNFIILSDTGNQNLFAIDPAKEEIILNTRAKNIRWSADKSQLLYYNDWEMWVYYLGDSSKELIARYGNEIKEAIWYPLPGWLIFSQKIAEDKNVLTAIELDSRDYRQTIQLVEVERIDNLVIDSEGKNIFFTAKIGNQEGLYGLNIH